MIGRSRPRRAAGALSLEIAEDLPIWHPEPPAQGWTPATVWTAAADYADDHAEPHTWRRITADAARALFRAEPAVKHAEILERLRGLDRRALTLAEPLDDGDPAPF